MADGYLESHYAEYEKKKAEWLKKKKKFSYGKTTSTNSSSSSSWQDTAKRERQANVINLANDMIFFIVF